MQVEDFLESSAERLPNKVALVCGDQRVTYAEINMRANRLAWGLQELGVVRGDRVAICLENSIDCVVAMFAALKSNGVFLVLNPTTKAEKLAYILNNSGAKLLVTAPRKLQEIDSLLPQLQQLAAVVLAARVSEVPNERDMPTHTLDELVERHAGEKDGPPKEAIDIDLAALVYTSGSTGNPKGVMLTHLNIVSAATSITSYLKNREDDIILNVLPLSFDYGLYQVLMAFKFGGTVVLERSMAYPFVLIQKLVDEKITGFPIVPTILSILLKLDLSKYDLSHLRYVSNTGAALPVAHILRLRELFPNVQIYSMYGLTECKRVAYLSPELVDERPDSVGKAMPNVEVYVVDEQGQRLPPGSTGQLVIRGSNVMKGYWELPEETEKMLKPGPLPGEKILYSGDLFRIDEEGFLYFKGRLDDIIKSRGEKVSPKEVENVLYSLDGIVDAAVIGVDDPLLGQAIKAFVTILDGRDLSEKRILQYCSEHLEDFMVPKFVQICPELPKNPSGKIDKKQLQGL